MKHIEAMRLALEALEAAPAAIFALREALAEQAVPKNMGLTTYTRDETEHGKNYYLAGDVDALLGRLEQQAGPVPEGWKLAIERFAAKERGIPQAHIAAELLAELDAMLAAAPAPQAEQDVLAARINDLIRNRDDIWAQKERLETQLSQAKSRISALEKITTQPAPQAEQPAQQQCWCTTCRPITLTDMRFVVCPKCGNKRCPKANDHRNACTGSNDVGQKGSSWEHVKPVGEEPAQQEPKKDMMYSTVAMQERHAARVDRAVATLERIKREALAEQPAQPQSELHLDARSNYNITFQRDGKQIGVLDFNGPCMTFTGEADESANIFFDFIAKSFKGRLEQERTYERARMAEQPSPVLSAGPITPEMASWSEADKAKLVSVMTEHTAQQPSPVQHEEIDPDSRTISVYPDQQQVPAQQELQHDEHAPQCSADDDLLRGILASELRCWHRLTPDEAENLVAFVRSMPSKQPAQQEPQATTAPRNIIWDSRHPDYPVEWSNPGRPAKEGEVHYIRYDLFADAVHAPPQRQPLAYAELMALAKKSGIGPENVSGLWQARLEIYGRAIEAAHGIKEKNA